jgi:hypothetical protein
MKRGSTGVEALISCCRHVSYVLKACKGGNKSLPFYNCVCCCCPQMVVEDGCFSAALMESNIVSVSDMVSETSERLEFRDAVVKMSIGEVLLGASGMYKGCLW